jgi:hypothetical protein
MEIPQTPLIWPLGIPADCPFERSREFDRVAILPRHKWYGNSDTWYPSWAADDFLYSGWTDGDFNGWHSYSGHGEHSVTAVARIQGSHPLDLKIENLSKIQGPACPYVGRYPSAYLVKDDVFYYGTYCLDIIDDPRFPHKHANTPGDPVMITNIPYKGPDAKLRGLSLHYLGPFVGFSTSRDQGRTWTPCPHTPAAPLFKEPQNGFEEKVLNQPSSVKIGSPHFVDFGKNMEHSPDGKAYLVAHGALDGGKQVRTQRASWCNGDAIYLLRVLPGVETINDAAAYEFFAGHDSAGQPVWSNDLGQIRPVLAWENNMGIVTVSYNAALRKYLMAVTDGTDTLQKYNSYFLEADTLTGPWRIISYLKDFGEQAYFINFPTKFIDPRDPTKMWMLYSGNYANCFGFGLQANLPGSRYGMCWQEIQFLRPRAAPCSEMKL